MMRSLKVCMVFILLLALAGCQDAKGNVVAGDNESVLDNPPEPVPEDNESVGGIDRPACMRSFYYKSFNPIRMEADCRKATKTQLKKVNQGNEKRDEFLSRCYTETNNSCWCDHLVRPNPNSIDTFYCTYGEAQVHQLIHPDESTWKNAFEAVKIIEELEDKHINTQIIYNWWRPEPYNKNVGGSATRHPYGTSIDVRFESKDMQEKAFYELCKMRKEGRIRAIGYYASTALHFGIGDNKANTWGKSCP